MPDGTSPQNGHVGRKGSRGQFPRTATVAYLDVVISIKFAEGPIGRAPCALSGLDTADGRSNQASVVPTNKHTDPQCAEA